MNIHLRAKTIFYRNARRLAGGLMLLVWVFSRMAAANPIGPSVVSGGASVSGVGTNQVIVNQTTPQAVLHWQQFNIAPNEVTRFIQPSAQSIALNRIFDANPSQIFGSLQANGSVILLNPNGVLFGPGAQVNVNGLIASSLDLKNEDFLSGQYRFGVFDTPSVRGAVTNQGTIETPAGGYVYLFAPNVANNGVIRTPEGEILLTAGTKVFLSDHPDGSGFLWEVLVPPGQTVNSGSLIADGGHVALFGRAVRQAGLIQANGVQEKNGRIELIALDRVDIAGGQAVADKGELSIRQTDLEVDDTLFSQLSGQRVQDITLQAYRDITVDAFAADLSTWQATGSAERTLSFSAGNDLHFNPIFLFNPTDTFGVKWNVKGSAANDITFAGAHLWLGNGGGFNFEAGRDIRIETDTATSSPSYLWSLSGGEIRLKAGRDVIAPLAFDTNNGVNMYSGIRLAGDLDDLISREGHLTIEAGRDFLGGFTLGNGTATISTGRNFGRSSVGRYSDSDQNFSYANLILGKGTIQVDAGEGVYLGRIQDLGLAEMNVATLDPGNAVSLTAETRDIHLNPNGDPDVLGRYGASGFQRSSYYSPTFTARADAGSIFIERDLTFWPSLTGALDFSARHDIQGTVSTAGPSKLTLLNADPNVLAGKTAFGIDSLIPNNPLRLGLSETDQAHDPAPVRFQTEQGDISQVYFNFKTGLKKEVLISSGHDLKQFTAELMIPEGVEATIRADHDIRMNRFVAENGTPIESGISFYGTGRGTIYAGHDLDLGNSNGIQQRLPFSIEQVAAGLIDISVGNDLKMTFSRIYTYNGASLSIHGINGPESPVGGIVDVGTNDRTLSTDRGIATVGGGSIDILATGDVNVNSSRVATFGGGDIRITSTQGNINAGFGGADDTVEIGIPVVVIGPDGNVVLNDDGSVKTNQRFVTVPGSGIFTYHPDDPAPLPPYPPKPALEIPSFEPTLPPPSPPDLPPFPEKTPEMVRLEREILKRRMVGQDTSALETLLLKKFQDQAEGYEREVTALYDQYREDYKRQAEASYQLQLQEYRTHVAELQAEANQQYDATKAEHRKDWKLGDIELQAKEAAVVVPPAGIRGRKITIVAKTLDLQGGEIGGDSNINVDQLIGDQGSINGPGNIKVGDDVLTEITLPSIPAFTISSLPSFSLPSIPTGASGGGGGLGGLSGSTGSISAATSGSVTTASAAATVQEKVAEQARGEEPSATASEVTEGGPEADGTVQQTAQGKKKRSGKYRTLQIRRGVLIQVEVHEEQP